MYRDRSKIIRRIVIIGILLLALGGGAVALHSVYTVRTVYVEGNVHYTEDEIMEIVMSGPLGDNSLYLSLKYRDRGIQDIPFVDVMNVSILAPDTIKITVYEKALAGYVKYLDTYMYLIKTAMWWKVPGSAPREYRRSRGFPSTMWCWESNCRWRIRRCFPGSWI